MVYFSSYSEPCSLPVFPERKAKEAEAEMSLIARRAREENRQSLTRVSQLIMNANRLTMGEKPPLPPK